METASAGLLGSPVSAQPAKLGEFWGKAKNLVLVTLFLSGLGAYGFLLVASVIWLTSH